MLCFDVFCVCLPFSEVAMALRLVPRGLLPFWDGATRTALAALPGPRPGRRRKLSPALPRH